MKIAKIVKITGRIISIASLVAFVLTGSAVAVVAALGFTSFNVGILVGERSAK